eukprot:scaffold20937_cov33-Tisochrysis_lutea.AAC.3
MYVSFSESETLVSRCSFSGGVAAFVCFVCGSGGAGSGGGFYFALFIEESRVMLHYELPRTLCATCVCKDSHRLIHAARVIDGGSWGSSRRLPRRGAKQAPQSRRGEKVEGRRVRGRFCNAA